MIDSKRVYTRKKIVIPFTFYPDNVPAVASPTQALPVSPQGIIKKEFFGAAMKDSCSDGFSFITEKKLDPGTEIEAKMVNFMPLDLGGQKLDECQAKVKWCRENRRVGETTCYDVGVQKIRKDNLPIIDLKNPNFASMKCV
ncbi:MAG: hypothetical protein KKD44_13430 [Proteobacteria bacterium]|nr:hypothetical protein [Pseudomonadota bacterium]